jgi:hypothetical protein
MSSMALCILEHSVLLTSTVTLTILRTVHVCVLPSFRGHAASILKKAPEIRTLLGPNILMPTPEGTKYRIADASSRNGPSKKIDCPDKDKTRYPVNSVVVVVVVVRVVVDVVVDVDVAGNRTAGQSMVSTLPCVLELPSQEQHNSLMWAGRFKAQLVCLQGRFTRK